MGFAFLSLFVGALQVMLDRGPTKGWFDSLEIRIEAAVTALAFYLFVVHTLTAERPFIRLALYKDRNFLSGNVLIFLVGIVLFATLALLPPLLQELNGYSVFQAGLVTAPRGVGTLLAMLFVGRLVGVIDTRLIIAVGMALTAISLWQMSHFSMQLTMSSVVWSGVLQGFGTGIVYVPMAALTFATLPGVDAQRGHGAIQSGAQRRQQRRHLGRARACWCAIPSWCIPHWPNTDAPMWSRPHGLGPTAMGQTLAALNRAVTAQATMIAYLDDFLLCWC